MAVGEIQISALPQASLPIELSDIFHLKQGIEDKRCTLEQLLLPHASLKNNPHGVTKVQVQLGNVINALQLTVANNLSDVASVSEARKNLGILSSDEVNALLNKHLEDFDNPHKVDKNQVKLGNVNNWQTSTSYTENADKYASIKAVNALYKAVQNCYPVGYVHLSTNSANPSTYLICGGTWKLISQGRALVGHDESPSGRKSGDTFGASTYTLTQGNMAAHTHSVTLSGGSHTHSASVSISNYDYGSKATSSFDYGTRWTSDNGNHAHNYSGWTSANGNHNHPYQDLFLGVNPGDWNEYPNHTEHIETGDTWYATHKTDTGARIFPYMDRNTFDAGNHSHSFSGTTDWHGQHSHTVAIGNHSHTVSIGAHGHTGTVSVAASEHSHSGNTSSVGSNQAFSIEQPSFVLYVWQRTA